VRGCHQIDDIKKLLGAVKADMVFTDPPYNVAHVSHEKSGKFPTEQARFSAIQQSQEDFEASVKRYSPIIAKS